MVIPVLVALYCDLLVHSAPLTMSLILVLRIGDQKVCCFAMIDLMALICKHGCCGSYCVCANVPACFYVDDVLQIGKKKKKKW